MPDQPTDDVDVEVLVVDDQPQFLGAAREVIDATAGFHTAGSAMSADAAVHWLETGAADIVVMDVRMPGKDGVEAARALARRRDRPVVVLCSTDERPDIAADPAAHGADAFYRKERFVATLLREVWKEFGAARRPLVGP